NQTWDFIEKEDRNPDEDEMMVHCAHTSRYHWGIVGVSLNFQRGDWILSRVYTILKRGSEALHYAKLCMKHTEENNIKDFDLAYAYEALARSYAAAEDKTNFEKYNNLAKEAGDKIEKKQNREIFKNDLKTGNWFGLK
ncbi:MAG: hypothetical protein HeimC2_29150, partial [Candidatus Heimdallarchaeota archaeon LC_2]